MEEKKLNLYQKIVEIRKCVPFLKKDEAGYKYKYVAGVSILRAIHDKMNELGVLLMPSVKNKTYHIESSRRIIEADMTMTWIDAATGEKMEVEWLLFGEQDDISKAFGSGLTYSERYYLLKALNIPTDEDDPDKNRKIAGVSSTDKTAIGKIDNLEDLKKFWGKNRSKNSGAIKDFDEFISLQKKRIEKMNEQKANDANT